VFKIQDSSADVPVAAVGVEDADEEEANVSPVCQGRPSPLSL